MGKRRLKYHLLALAIVAVWGVTFVCTKVLIGGTVLALAGMALVVFDGQRLQLSARGDLLAIGAAICWAAYSLFLGRKEIP